jgi:hypothetical protein
MAATRRGAGPFSFRCAAAAGAIEGERAKQSPINIRVVLDWNAAMAPKRKGKPPGGDHRAKKSKQHKARCCWLLCMVARSKT